MGDDNKVYLYVGGFIIFCIIMYFIINNKGSGFNDVLSGNIDNSTPKLLPELLETTEIKNEPINGIPRKLESVGIVGNEQQIPLLKPDVPEEIGFPLYGKGVSTDPADSNVFISEKNPGSLHTEYNQNDSIGESSYSDQFGSRIIKLNSAGIQSSFLGKDEAEFKYEAGAYNKPPVQSGYTLLNYNNPINYSSNFNPSSNLKIETPPGQYTSTDNCETTYPNTINNNGVCLTAGDIPYNTIVNGKVNPRLVSRWESLTGSYDPNQIIKQSSSLYPII